MLLDVVGVALPVVWSAKIAHKNNQQRIGVSNWITNRFLRCALVDGIRSVADFSVRCAPYNVQCCESVCRLHSMGFGD